MTDPLALHITTKIKGISLDVTLDADIQSSDQVRILANTLAGSQASTFTTNQLRVLHSWLCRVITAAEIAE